MKLYDLANNLSLNEITLSEDDREITGVYIGDLLSWVMGRAKCGDVWITIMSNINIVAVASLADVACVILAEGVTLPSDVRNTAEQKGVTVYSSEKDAYELAVAISKLIQ